VVIFSLVIGVTLPLFWVVAVTSRRVPEITEGPKEIWFHIGAETLTGMALIRGGNTTWASPTSAWAVAAS